MDSANCLTPVASNMSLRVRHCSFCVSDPASFLNASSLPLFVSHGDIEAQRVLYKSLCLGIAQSYRELKVHITTTPSISCKFATALNTLRAMAELPMPGLAVQTYSPFALLWRYSWLAQVWLLGFLPSLSSDSSDPYVKLHPPAIKFLLINL